MYEIARRSTPDLKQLDPALKPEVREWVLGLRPIWAAAGLSLNEFVALNPIIDKSTISRWLSGKRVPGSNWFLDRLLGIVTDNGQPVTLGVREHLTRLQLRALESAHPHAYKVRLLQDQLAIAVTGRREAERYARALEEQLAEREREIQGLTEDNDRLRAAWNFEYQRLAGEIEQLTRDLDSARRRAAAAEGRCTGLGSILDLMEQAHPDRRQEGDHSHSVDWDSTALRLSLNDLNTVALHLPLDDLNTVALHLPLDDLNAVAFFLSGLLRLDLRDQAAALADRVVSDITARHRSPNGITTKHDGLLRVLATLNAHGLYNQADKLSCWMGYPNSHSRLTSHHSEGGRYS
jgi:hypothetical protein